MNNYTSYNRVLFSILAPIFFSIILLTTYIEPPSKELTRMGGYLENNFGENSLQQHFDPPLYSSASSVEQYNKYYDVVVFGDSFSGNKSQGWQNYLANEIGLSNITFNMALTKLTAILKNQTFISTPPKLFIYETVERNLITRHKRCNGVPEQLLSIPNQSIKPTEIQALDVKPVWLLRDTDFSIARAIDFKKSINYLKKFISRKILNINISEVHKFDLKVPGLFSSKINDAILILTRDFKLKGVTDHQIKIAQCDLLQLQKLIQSNNKTHFIALVFPDKTSIYSELFVDKSYSNMSIINHFERTSELNITQLYDTFRENINNGLQDLYLPNDSHCSYIGYQLAAAAVVDVMKRSKMISRL